MGPAAADPPVPLAATDDRPAPLRVVAAEGRPTAAPRSVRKGESLPDPGAPTHHSWGRFCDWAAARHRSRGGGPEPGPLAATCELAGRLGELDLAFLEGGVRLAASEAARADVASLAGAVFFAASWALDRWGWNPLRAIVDEGEPAIVDPRKLTAEADLCRRLALAPAGREGHEATRVHFEYLVGSQLLIATAYVAQACGAAQALATGREQVGPRAQADAIVAGLASLQAALAAVGVPVARALEAAVTTLDGPLRDTEDDTPGPID